ncbi:MAG: ATP synthase subunit I [Sterolibacterium sp.]|nr:ATP synthase subunit I [Sterolibacterium sp.]
MHRTLLLQIAATLLAAGLGGLLAGTRGGLSALFGGLAYMLPNLVFVVRLKIATSTGRASGVSFFVGEFGKIVATIGILVAVQQWYVDLLWWSLLIGLLAALKANLFAFLLKS